jgi:hypothetical protein
MDKNDFKKIKGLFLLSKSEFLHKIDIFPVMTHIERMLFDVAKKHE